MTDTYRVYRPILELIKRAEGTAPPNREYNETLAYGDLTGGHVNLINMTLAEIDQLQTQMLRHPNNRWNSSALGAYQIVRTTLRQIKKTLKIADTKRFSPELQDRFGCFLLGRRGIDDWIKGDLPLGHLIDALSQEWASLPTTEGVGYYSNQPVARATVAEVTKALKEVKTRYYSNSSNIDDDEEFTEEVIKPNVSDWIISVIVFGGFAAAIVFALSQLL